MSGDTHVAAVVGARSQVGRSIVSALLRRGWAVAAFDSEPGAAEAARAAKPGEQEAHPSDGPALDVTFDTADRESVRRAVESAAAELGEVECLIAVSGPRAPRPVAEITTTAWRAELHAQLLSAANFAWAVLPAMLARGAGNVVTVGSDVALGAPGGDAMQAAAGASVIGFAKALAIELAKTGVQVNAISAQLDGEENEYSGPLGRAVLADEIAATAAYLAAERHFFLGQVLSPNGGRVI